MQVQNQRNDHIQRFNQIFLDEGWPRELIISPFSGKRKNLQCNNNKEKADCHENVESLHSLLWPVWLIKFDPVANRILREKRNRTLKMHLFTLLYTCYEKNESFFSRKIGALAKQTKRKQTKHLKLSRFSLGVSSSSTSESSISKTTLSTKSEFKLIIKNGQNY